MEADKLHHLGRKLLRFGAAIADSSVEHEVPKAHDAESDTPGAACSLLNLGNCRHVLVGVDHVIQEASRRLDGSLELVPVHLSGGFRVLGQIDRAQATVLIRAQPLLTAGIGSLQFIQVRNRIVPVGTVHKEDARLTVPVSIPDDFVKHFACSQTPPNTAILRIDQLVLFVGFDGTHKVVGNTHRDVKVCDVPFLALAADELEDVGVVHA